MQLGQSLTPFRTRLLADMDVGYSVESFLSRFEYDLERHLREVLSRHVLSDETDLSLPGFIRPSVGQNCQS
ncbi:MAG: hypothetical protein ACJASX_000255 [Limisphaerales bacterium]|jgi:hypothetical protein